MSYADLKDNAFRFARAALTNQVAQLFPRLYIRLTKQTGRGSGEESFDDIAEYFHLCFREYFERLAITPEQIPQFLNGKHLIEYGPGDFPGVAILMYAWGAEKIYCVDRFPMMVFSEKNVAALRRLLDALPPEQKLRANHCFASIGSPESGLRQDCIEYIVNSKGLSGLRNAADLIYSRAVLEHVNDLQASINDMKAALREGGTMIHKIDLKSHGLHKTNRLDFLTWSNIAWRLMYSAKGVPNRLRVDRYRKALDQAGFKIETIEPVETARQSEIEEVRPHLAKDFRDLSDEDLSWLSFWLIARH